MVNRIPRFPNSLSLENIFTPIFLPISHDIGIRGVEEQNTRIFFISILIFRAATTVINNHIITDARMKARPFFCFIIMSFLS